MSELRFGFDPYLADELVQLLEHHPRLFLGQGPHGDDNGMTVHSKYANAQREAQEGESTERNWQGCMCRGVSQSKVAQRSRARLDALRRPCTIYDGVDNN